MPGDVIGTRINWELRKAMMSAPADVKHFGGTLRCIRCGIEDKCVIAAPLWAACPPMPACNDQGCALKGGLMVFVHADDEPPEGAEPYDYFVVLPEDRDR